MSALLLLSGGLDSALVLTMPDIKICAAMFVDYGQPAAIQEEQAAMHISTWYGVDLITQRVRGVAMVGCGSDPGRSPYYYAHRNIMLLSMGAAVAESRGYESVAIGCNADDRARFPDCRAEYLKAAETVLRPTAVVAPLLSASKREIVRTARDHGLRIESTWTCYTPQDGDPCGQCDACRARDAACMP
jgi:7-cyano-7-deazaguanine synthase